MIKVYDYRCSNQHVFEVFTDNSEKVFKCGCGADARRILSPVRSQLEGFSGDFPGAAMRWEREHERGGKETRDAE